MDRKIGIEAGTKRTKRIIQIKLRLIRSRIRTTKPIKMPRAIRPRRASGKRVMKLVQRLMMESIIAII